MACESCRSQARTLLLRVARGPAARSSLSRHSYHTASSLSSTMPTTTTKTTATATATATTATITQAPTASAAHGRRFFSGTSSRRLLGGIGEQYRVLGASERLYKACAKAADYRITEEERKNEKVERLEDGEEVGTPLVADNVWHSTFKLPPTFSTWSHVTMLHLYLINCRIRMLDRDAYRNWQQQLIDHFFFDCEKKMHIDHSITSSALRQRYLKDIFVQWRGLLLAYDEGLIKGDAVLASAVWRNLFKGSPSVDPRALLAIVGWMRSGLMALEGAPDAALTDAAFEVLDRPVETFWTRLEGPFRSQQQLGDEALREREKEALGEAEEPVKVL